MSGHEAAERTELPAVEFECVHFRPPERGFRWGVGVFKPGSTDCREVVCYCDQHIQANGIARALNAARAKA